MRATTVDAEPSPPPVAPLTAARACEDAAERHDGTQRVYESTDTASRQRNVRAAVDAKPDVSVLVGFESADLVAQQAQKNPVRWSSTPICRCRRCAPSPRSWPSG